jgi:hypothetical protein
LPTSQFSRALPRPRPRARPRQLGGAANFDPGQRAKIKLTCMVLTRENVHYQLFSREWNEISIQ